MSPMIELTLLNGNMVYTQKMGIFLIEPSGTGSSVTLMAIGTPGRVLRVQENPQTIVKRMGGRDR